MIRICDGKLELKFKGESSPEKKVARRRRKSWRFPAFARFSDASGDPLPEDVSNYDAVKRRLGCKPFAWYIDRFENVRFSLLSLNMKECASLSRERMQSISHCVPVPSHPSRMQIFHKSGVMAKTVFQLTVATGGSEQRHQQRLCLERTGSVLGHAQVAEGPLGVAPCDAGAALQLWHLGNRGDDGGFATRYACRYSDQ